VADQPDSEQSPALDQTNLLFHPIPLFRGREANHESPLTCTLSARTAPCTYALLFTSFLIRVASGIVSAKPTSSRPLLFSSSVSALPFSSDKAAAFPSVWGSHTPPVLPVRMIDWGSIQSKAELAWRVHLPSLYRTFVQ